MHADMPHLKIKQPGGYFVLQYLQLQTTYSMMHIARIQREDFFARSHMLISSGGSTIQRKIKPFKLLDQQINAPEQAHRQWLESTDMPLEIHKS